MNTHPRNYTILVVFLIIILSACASHRPPTREECLELAGALAAEVRVRHILVKDRTLAASIRDQLLHGSDFDTLAFEHSISPDKAKGGDLGFFARGKMVKAFEDAAFEQPVGDIGPVVETPLGFHIIQVLERRQESLREASLWAITAQLSELTHYLTTSGNWTNESAARPIYNSLKQKNPAQVTNALVYNVCYPEGRNRLVYLISAVKLGMAGSAQRLNALLMRYGDKSMAEDYLNSGSAALDTGGRQWAAARGYQVMTGPGSHRARWGRF